MPLREEKYQPNINEYTLKNKTVNRGHKGKTPGKKAKGKTGLKNWIKRSPPSVEKLPAKKLIMEIPDVTED